MINRELLVAVRDRIRDHPDLFDNQHWAARIRTGTVSKTTHCVAGWAIVLSGGRFDWHPSFCHVRRTRGCHVLIAGRVDPATVPNPLVYGAAQTLLGLDDRTSVRLFRGDNTAEEVLAIIDETLADAGAADDR